MTYSATPVIDNCKHPLVRSKGRVNAYGEVFTSEWMISAMLDLVKGESERVDSRVLEPACGSGNFLAQVLTRKLATVDSRYGKSEFERKHHALLGLMCMYGIELLADNVAECRANLLEIFNDHLGASQTDEIHRAAAFILSLNIINGDSLAMCMADGQSITFAEWGYLGKGKYQRRDFRLSTLTQMSSFGGEGTPFAELGKHEVFIPVTSYLPLTVVDLAIMAAGGAK
jgi:hypothetical protein